MLLPLQISLLAPAGGEDCSKNRIPRRQGSGWQFEGLFVALSMLLPLQISLLAPAGGDVQLEELQHARRQGEGGSSEFFLGGRF